MLQLSETTHAENRLDDILQILVEEKEEVRGTILRSDSAFAKNKAKSDLGFTIYHLPRSQIKFLAEFNEHRIIVVGDLIILFNMADVP